MQPEWFLCRSFLQAASHKMVMHPSLFLQKARRASPGRSSSIVLSHCSSDSGRCCSADYPMNHERHNQCHVKYRLSVPHDMPIPELPYNQKGLLTAHKSVLFPTEWSSLPEGYWPHNKEKRNGYSL